MERTFGQYAGAGGGDADQVGDGVLVGREEPVEDRGHQEGATPVRLEGPGQAQRIGLLAERAAQGPTLSAPFAKLLGELHKRGASSEIGAVLLDVAIHQPGQREVLEQRHDVGEAFVEGVDVEVRGFLEPRSLAVNQGVRRLVDENVV